MTTAKSAKIEAISPNMLLDFVDRRRHFVFREAVANTVSKLAQRPCISAAL